MDNIYTGIGARKTPEKILKDMRQFARVCAEHNYTLRSGGARGADRAFEEGCGLGYKEIYLPGQAEDWCYTEILKYLDPGHDFKRFRPFVKDLLARNMHQILGKDGKTPTQFVICWTLNGKDVGGTRYALRCARAYQVPIINLGTKEGREMADILRSKITAEEELQLS